MYIDQDWLCIIAKKGKEDKKIQGDNYLDVIDFLRDGMLRLKDIKKNK